jgi:hypothetical protein
MLLYVNQFSNPSFPIFPVYDRNITPNKDRENAIPKASESLMRIYNSHPQAIIPVHIKTCINRL